MFCFAVPICGQLRDRSTLSAWAGPAVGSVCAGRGGL